MQSYEELSKGDFVGAPSTCFQSKFYINVQTEDAARLTKFEQKTHTTYRILKGSKTLGSILLFKTVKHCQHFRKYDPAGKVPKRLESLRQKKTECPSQLILRVYSKRPTVVKKLPVPDHLCEVDIIYDHDHPIDSAHTLSFRDVSEDTQEMFYEYFSMEHSVASARHEHELRLQLSSSESFLAETLLADRATNPNVQDVSRLFAAWRMQQHGPDSGQDMFDRLEKEVKTYNDTHSDDGGKAIIQCCSSQVTEKAETSQSQSSSRGKPLILAI